jgi:hypothetical protein
MMDVEQLLPEAGRDILSHHTMKRFSESQGSQPVPLYD